MLAKLGVYQAGNSVKHYSSIKGTLLTIEQLLPGVHIIYLSIAVTMIVSKYSNRTVITLILIA